MRKRINWVLSIVITVLLLSLMPTRAEAGAAVTINSVVAAAENVMPALGKTAAVDGTDITITSPADVTVEGLEGTKALLIVAQYSGKQMKALRCRSVTSDCVVIPESFAHSAGCTYKVFLVSSGVCVPLCSPTVLSQ